MRGGEERVSTELQTGRSFSLGKTPAFSATLTCLIIRNSAVAEIYSLNIINKMLWQLDFRPHAGTQEKINLQSLKFLVLCPKTGLPTDRIFLMMLLVFFFPSSMLFISTERLKCNSNIFIQLLLSYKHTLALRPNLNKKERSCH